MNNIALHFTTAWLDLYLKNDADRQVLLELAPHSSDGVYATDEKGNFTNEHTYWAGLQDRTATILPARQTPADDHSDPPRFLPVL